MDSSIKLRIKHEQLFSRRETNFTKMNHSLRLFFDEENLLGILTGKKHRQTKLQRLQKVRI